MAGRFNYSQDRFLGLNKGSDETLFLKKGESPRMVNFTVSDSYALKKRRGYRVLCRHKDGGRGIGHLVSGQGEWTVYAAGKSVYAYKDGEETLVGELESESGQLDFLRFSDKLYILDGKRIKVFDGKTLSDIEPYRPLVAISTTPDGAGVSYEERNLLTGSMRQCFTMNSTKIQLQLAMKELESVDYVRVDEVELAKGSYAVDLARGTVTIPDKYREHPTPNGIEIGFTVPNGDSAELIHSMRHAVFYGGENDTRVFLYGDENNPCIIRYSGVHEGESGFEYFPESSFNKIGASSKITSLIRHYDRLVSFCPSEAFYLYEEKVSDENGKVYSVFPTRPLSDSVGCEAEGFALTVDSFPVTFDRGTLFRWRSSSVRDERYAECFGERIKGCFDKWDIKKVHSFDSERTRELFVWCEDEIYVYNYSLDVFYYWKGISPCGFATLENGRILFESSEGSLCALFESDRDDTLPVEAVWETPYLSLAAGVKNLYSMTATVYPERSTRALVTWISDKGESVEKSMEGRYNTFSFEELDFLSLGFMTGVSPQRMRFRERHKRFERLKVRFSCPGDGELHLMGFSLEGAVTLKKER